jgi:hypothetical protein
MQCAQSLRMDGTICFMHSGPILHLGRVIREVEGEYRNEVHKRGELSQQTKLSELGGDGESLLGQIAACSWHSLIGS